MAVQIGVRTISGEAGTAITIYRFVSRDSTDKQYDHTGAAAQMDGVSQMDQADVGQAFPIAVNHGAVVKVEAGATVTEGAQVQSDATGRVIDHVSGVGVWRAGKAREAAVIGQIFEIDYAPSIDEVA